MPLFLAEMYRGISRCRLRLYPHAREVLDVLRERYPLAVVTDAQSAYARAELHKVGLLDYFDPIVVSGDHGYRKPDRRLFQLALDGMGVAAEHAMYVGNDMHRDIFGAREAGMTDRMVESDQGSRRSPGLRARLHDHRSPRPLDDPRRALTLAWPQDCASLAAMSARRRFFWILPVAVVGSSVTTSTRSGTFWMARPSLSRYSCMSVTVSGAAPGAGTR